MSFRSLLAHRCSIQRLDVTDVDGAPSYTWQTIKTNVRCRVDLSYSRGRKDPQWTPESGRPADRTGVAFFLPGTPIEPGDRIKVTKGESGFFEIDGALDTVTGRHGRVHHIEVGVTEVAQALGRGAAP